jgi:hypothetical protein
MIDTATGTVWQMVKFTDLTDGADSLGQRCRPNKPDKFEGLQAERVVRNANYSAVRTQSPNSARLKRISWRTLSVATSPAPLASHHLRDQPK